MVPGDNTRPITDRAKESLFNILQPSLPNSLWLDLFGGTGAVGIEGLSRGAAHCTFVELYRPVLNVLAQNLAHTGLGERATLAQADAFAYLKRPPKPVNVLYIAPPQYQNMWVRALDVLQDHPGWLLPEGEAIIQIHPRESRNVPDYITNWPAFELTDERKYGSTLFLFYQLVGAKQD